MIFLVLACTVVTAALIAVVSLWHRRAPAADGLAHARALYEAFVADVERRESKGEIDAGLANEERVEAARALLNAEETETARSRLKPAHAAIGVAAVAGASFALYALVIGNPEIPDQPYAPRLLQWAEVARQDPDSISPEALAAVLHDRAGLPENANNADFWLFLGRIDMMAGRYYDAAKAFDRSMKLKPQGFSGWADLGEALFFVAGGSVTPDAEKAFDKALAADANDARAHYYLGKRDLDAGNYESARAHFLTAKSQLAVDDGRQAIVAEQLQMADRGLEGEASTRTRISGMVASLEAQLAGQPENPDGWARLLRSYDVLGDPAGKQRALATMRAHYQNRPDVAADIVSKSQAAVGSENTGNQ